MKSMNSVCPWPRLGIFCGISQKWLTFDETLNMTPTIVPAQIGPCCDTFPPAEAMS